MIRTRAGAAGVGLAASRLKAEPPDELHPVAWFGSLMGALEGPLWADRRSAGVVHATVGAGIGLAAGAVVRSTALAVAVSSAGRMLRATATAVGEDLARGDLEAARERLPALVGRDPSELDESGVAAAVVESVAENTVDAVVAPACWGAVLGAPGALAHRAVNTLDAMVGHHSPRYERFGWAAARADDVANWVPARVTVGLVLLAAPPRRSAILAAVRHDAADHPSPNAGVAEAAFAGALGVELGGPLRYGDRHEERPRLGSGPRPQAADIGRAVALQSRVEWLLAGVLGLVGAVSMAERWR